MATVTTTPAARGIRPYVGPAVVAAGALAVSGFVYARNPATGRGFIPCPFRGITGLWCPGCGMTRGMHALLNGDIAGMFGMNIFLPVVLAMAVWGWVSWVKQARGHPPLAVRLPAWAWYTLGAVVLAFGVLRNLPVEPFSALAP